MNNSQTKSQAYSKVVKRASLENILLTASSFRVSHEYSQAVQDGVKRYLANSVQDTHFDAESNLLVGKVQCRVWMNRKGKEADHGPSEKSIFSVVASYVVIFEVPGEHKQDVLNVFMDRMGPFSVWPYFRGHVARVASEANLDVPILPIKKLFQSVEAVSGYVEPEDSAAPKLPKKGIEKKE
jgi:hypothetical protein